MARKHITESQDSRKKKSEREMEETHEGLSTSARADGCAPALKSDQLLRVCDQILETLREIRSDLSKLRDRFV